MPRRDGTGPEGRGPLTGRRYGPCEGGRDTGDYVGRGMGFGRGRGFGMGGGTTVRQNYDQPTKEEQKEAIKSDISYLRKKLEKY